ncbi:hypothetical protein CLU79DRAFT_848309 [Phycomyces nitens]|nr:hypothetical protein CLU79DRAFT_848309 [Phycomyces nitens]
MESIVKRLSTDTIQEWEIDQAKLLRQLNEFAHQITFLQSTLEKERKQYENTKSSLLRELKIKDVTFDKRSQQAQHDYKQQIQELKQQLEKEQQEHQDDIREWKNRHDMTLKTEQTNNARRIYGFQERLNAKETEYAQLQDHLRQTQSEPNSPVRAVFGEISQDDRISFLEDTIAHMRREHSAERRAWQAQLELQENNPKHPESREISPPQSLEISFLNMFSKKKNPSLSGSILQDTAKLNEHTLHLKESHAKKTEQMMINFENEINRLKDLFINESRRVSMQHEARIQNLVAEHDQTIRDMIDEHSNAKEILKIEYQNQQEEFVELNNQKLRQELEKSEQIWLEKLNIANMSMSKDASEIQAHWDKKREDMVAIHNAEIEHCQDELEVMKHRLRMMAETLKENQSKVVGLQDLQKLSTIECTRLQLSSKKTILALSKIEQEHRQARRVAKEIVHLVDSDSLISEDMTLPDILQKARFIFSNLPKQDSNPVTYMPYFGF